jgi:hypothetical protein
MPLLTVVNKRMGAMFGKMLVACLKPCNSFGRWIDEVMDGIKGLKGLLRAAPKNGQLELSNNFFQNFQKFTTLIFQFFH